MEKKDMAIMQILKDIHEVLSNIQNARTESNPELLDQIKAGITLLEALI